MGGTGLGLSIAKEILDQNGGMMNINSEYGKGTEVVIRIPTKQNSIDKETRNQEEEKAFEEVTQKVGLAENTKE
jgi:signal transduction histidine kinase